MRGQVVVAHARKCTQNRAVLKNSTFRQCVLPVLRGLPHLRKVALETVLPPSYEETTQIQTTSAPKLCYIWHNLETAVYEDRVGPMAGRLMLEVHFDHRHSINPNPTLAAIRSRLQDHYNQKGIKFNLYKESQVYNSRDLKRRTVWQFTIGVINAISLYAMTRRHFRGSENWK